MGAILWGFQRARDWMPELYSAAECIQFCETMVQRGWVTVLTLGDSVRGFMARDGAEICALYLDEPVAGQGLGQLLLERAKAEEDRLWLRCAEANDGAQRFYARAGFVETARSDGTDRAEKVPDITFVWPKGAWG